MDGNTSKDEQSNDATMPQVMAVEAPDDDDDQSDADTAEILKYSSHSALSGGGTGGLCGVVDTTTCVVPTMNVKGRITDLKQRGHTVISRLRRGSTGENSSSDITASLYDPSLYHLNCGMDSAACNENVEFVMNEAAVKAMEEEPIPASVLANPDRTICVITTAALPWRTGTAVNPLLRALYLVRFQNERRKELLRQQEIDEKQQGNEAQKDGSEQTSSKEDENTSNLQQTSGGSVALVIPWLESESDRIKLYGSQNSFSNGPTGIQQQETWIRNYSSERCGMALESKQLQLIFYPAFYLAGFGSIFPKVDLCNFIPRELVDVAILEEPEHLNWFRMPNQLETSRRDIGGVGDVEEDDDNDDEEGDNHGQKKEGEKGCQSEGLNNPPGMGENDAVLGQKVEVTINHAQISDLVESDQLLQNNDATDVSVVTEYITKNDDDESQLNMQPTSKKYNEKAKLGWTSRFNFVVGIVHTNYEAYARQYGIGASLIAAPAIGAVSALTIRAHTHQVIKLSDTLPNFAPGKEVTCNVHGVRTEFLEGVDLDVLASASSKLHDKNKTDGESKCDDDGPSPVYFIGKLVWAKGFDLMLELQDIFRKRKGEYFRIDVYGGGPDEKAIARAFHGRNHHSPTKRPPPPSSKSSDGTPSNASSHPPNPKDVNAAAVFANTQSIRDQSNEVAEQIRQQSLSTDGDDVVSQYLSLGFEVCQLNGSATYVKESRRQLSIESGDENNDSKGNNPLDILGDLSGKSFDTGVKTSQAVYNIADSSIKNILTMSFKLKHPLKARRKKTQLRGDDEKQNEPTATTAKDDGETEEQEDKPHFVFDPPASRYEWRRYPIPAKFPGVIDHAQLKNIAHKIFLNPSTSEVLCTTTAEALVSMLDTCIIVLAFCSLSLIWLPTSTGHEQVCHYTQASFE